MAMKKNKSNAMYRYVVLSNKITNQKIRNNEESLQNQVTIAMIWMRSS